MKKNTYWLYVLLLACLQAVGLLSCTHPFSCKDLEDDPLGLLNNLKSRSDSLEFYAELNRVLNKEPGCFNANQLKGRMELTRGEFKQALRSFHNAFKSDSADIYTLYALASLYNAYAVNDSALLFIQKAIRIQEAKKVFIDYNAFDKKQSIKYSELLFFRGIIFMETRRFAAAKLDFEDAIVYQHDKAEGYAYLSIVCNRLGKPDSSCYYLEESKKLGFYETIDSLTTAACKKK